MRYGFDLPYTQTLFGINSWYYKDKMSKGTVDIPWESGRECGRLRLNTYSSNDKDSTNDLRETCLDNQWQRFNYNFPSHNIKICMADHFVIVTPLFQPRTSLCHYTFVHLSPAAYSHLIVRFSFLICLHLQTNSALTREAMTTYILFHVFSSQC